MKTQTCAVCGGETIRLTNYRGQMSKFNARETTAAGDVVPVGMRWYLSRDRGAVPGTLVDRPVTAPFLTLHNCRGARSGDDVLLDEQGREVGLIADHKGPRVPDIDLDGDVLAGSRLWFSYRWPSSWAHIVHVDRGLCGSAVLHELSDAEKRRLQQMPVCPECLRRRARRMQ